MAFENLIVYNTRKEARKVRSAGECIIRTDGGYAIVSSAFYRVLKRGGRKQ